MTATHDTPQPDAGSSTIAEGTFYTIIKYDATLVLLDKQRHNLETKEQSFDEEAGTIADKGVIYDMDGIGHTVPIRWHYENDKIADAKRHAALVEKRYNMLYDATCPG